ncbi:MAG TPA: L-serine ammonia-lyase, iron-sulfur-dependent, subunit beta [Candidatus Stercorousia faecigallinarum]|nr:L-serine ammonia-lyase, iron-sulfur-dependent, subunit beta [Candidatus Stercorousia faecigallinarum]
MRQSSIIDIISPVMAGPSSSHTAGAVRLGLLARNVYNAKPDKITFKLYNSYALTGKGHGTDKGLLAGILGFSVDDVRIKNVFETKKAKNLNYEFEFLQDFNRHPNAVDFIFEGGLNLTVSGDSIGAGEIILTKINNFSVNLDGKYNTLLVVYEDVPGVISAVTRIIQEDNVNIASLHCDRSGKGKDASMCICLDGELSERCLHAVSELKNMYIVRYIKKLES